MTINGAFDNNKVDEENDEEEDEEDEDEEEEEGVREIKEEEEGEGGVGVRVKRCGEDDVEMSTELREAATSSASPLSRSARDSFSDLEWMREGEDCWISYDNCSVFASLSVCLFPFSSFHLLGCITRGHEKIIRTKFQWITNENEISKCGKPQHSLPWSFFKKEMLVSNIYFMFSQW